MKMLNEIRQDRDTFLEVGIGYKAIKNEWDIFKKKSTLVEQGRKYKNKEDFE